MISIADLSLTLNQCPVSWMDQNSDFDLIRVATHEDTTLMEFDAGIVIPCGGVPLCKAARASARVSEYPILRLLQELALVDSGETPDPKHLAGTVGIQYNRHEVYSNFGPVEFEVY